jgi:sugar phosphate isomerase/epimerase
MRFAICNEHWGQLPFAQVCERIAAAGYGGVEIAPFTLNEDPRELTDADAISVCKSAKDAGIEVIGLHWLLTKPAFLHITTPDATLRRDAAKLGRKLARLCAMMGGKFMVWGSPKARNLLPEWKYEDGFARAAEVVHSVAEEAGKYGVAIAMEPLGRKETNIFNTAEETIRFCQLVDHPACKLHLDVKAMSDEAKPIPQIIHESKEWFIHFHTNDPNLLGPGMGEVKYEPIIQALREVNYQGWLSTEVFDYTLGPDVIAERSIAYLKQVIAAS